MDSADVIRIAAGSQQTGRTNARCKQGRRQRWVNCEPVQKNNQQESLPP